MIKKFALAAGVALIAATLLAAPAKTRTIATTPALASELKHAINPELYAKLSALPIEGWVIVRGQIRDTGIIGTEISQSDGNGAYDALALKMTNEHKIRGNFTTDSHIDAKLAFFHLLVFNAGDQKILLHFMHVEQARYQPSPEIFILKAGKLKRVR